MTEGELRKSLTDAFKTAGLSRYIVRDQSQLFEVPEGYFLETVLSDGTKLDETENLIASVRRNVEGEGLQLISILRAIWSVKDVEWLGPSRGKDGGIRSADDFRAVLVSGGREAQVIVEVTRSALENLRGKVGSDAQILEIVKDFLRHQLSWGGAGYWDPLRYPRQVLNEAVILYLLGRRPVTAG